MNAYIPIKGDMGARGASLFRRLGPMTQTSSPKTAVVIAEYPTEVIGSFPCQSAKNCAK